MYENALYWLGQPAYYGERFNQTPTDPDALVNDAPEHYGQPALDVCAKNYNVLLTDGAPTQDVETQTLAPALPNYNTILGRTTCTFVGDGGCLEDISEYLGKVDTSAANDGTQTVTTHTIGFTIDLPLLRDTAEAWSTRPSAWSLFMCPGKMTPTMHSHSETPRPPSGGRLTLIRITVAAACGDAG